MLKWKNHNLTKWLKRKMIWPKSSSCNSSKCFNKHSNRKLEHKVLINLTNRNNKWFISHHRILWPKMDQHQLFTLLLLGNLIIPIDLHLWTLPTLMFLLVKHILIITPIINSILDGNMAMDTSNSSTMELKVTLVLDINTLRATIILKVTSMLILKDTKHQCQVRMVLINLF